MLCEAKGEPDEVGGELPRAFPGPFCSKSGLLDACASPLNQDDQHDDKKQAGNNPDNRGLIHFDSLPSLNGYGLVSEKRFERIRHDEDSGTEHNQKERGENEEHQWEQQLD